MTTKASKQPINWCFIIAGILLLLYSFYPAGPKISESNLSSGTITLNRGVEFIKGESKSPSFHRLWSNEYKAAFIIQVPGEVAAGFEQLDGLKKGDSLDIQYLTSDHDQLNNPSKELPIYSLQVNHHLLFSIHHYDTTSMAIEKRRTIFMLLIAALLIANGLSFINTKTTYILGAVALAVIIALKLLHRF